jgi:hypothetical protein
MTESILILILSTCWVYIYILCLNKDFKGLIYYVQKLINVHYNTNHCFFLKLGSMGSASILSWTLAGILCTHIDARYQVG